MIDELTLENVEEAAFESAEILFDYPEVATESILSLMEGDSPIKHRHVSRPFVRDPFSSSAIYEMQQYYSSLVKKVSPIARNIISSDPDVKSINEFNADAFVEPLARADFNSMSHRFLRTGVAKNTSDRISVKSLRGNAAISVTIGNVKISNFKNREKISKRLTEALNNATKNKYDGELFLTLHSPNEAGTKSTRRALVDSGINVELNFVVPLKWRA